MFIKSKLLRQSAVAASLLSLLGGAALAQTSTEPTMPETTMKQPQHHPAVRVHHRHQTKMKHKTTSGAKPAAPAPDAGGAPAK